MAYDPAMLKGSETRLWALIDERMRPGSDVRRIDERIWDLFGEEWAVMFTDLAGFSRGVAAFGIIHFLQIIHEQKSLLLPVVAAHDGILIKMEADSFLILFKRSAVALRCALEMQRLCHAVNATRTPEEKILLCLGIGYGKILRIGDTDVFGEEVNAASKLGEDVAAACEILVTRAARDSAGDVEGVSYEELQTPLPSSSVNYRARYALPEPAASV